MSLVGFDSEEGRRVEPARSTPKGGDWLVRSTPKGDWLVRSTPERRDS